MSGNILTSEELITAVKFKVASELAIKEAFNDDADLTHYGLDSMSTVRMLVSLEEEFQVTFEDEDLLLENFRTVIKIAQLLEKRK
ncbi:acyl carrier protein [Paenibacillus xylanilyticus]|uniref:acyl carrier protein n=1 Tax=Paenibacillus xylanilyticus TaxID=248903 RepID=UPI003AAD6CA8